MERKTRIQFLFQPSRALGAAGAARLTGELREIAGRARPDVPLPLACEPAALGARVLALARSPEGELRGFASAGLLPVRGLGEALYLETVRVPGPDREFLSSRLALALVRGYCLRFCFPARLWLVFDGSGPSRLGEAAECERALGTSLAVDDAARRVTRPATPASERWAGWLADVWTPTVCFELAGRVLETGFVGLGTVVAREFKRRLQRRRWTGAAAPV